MEPVPPGPSDLGLLKALSLCAVSRPDMHRLEVSVFRQETYVVAFRKEGVNWLEHLAFVGAATGTDVGLQREVHCQIVTFNFLLFVSDVPVLIFEAAVQAGRESRRHEWSSWHRLIQF